MLSNQPSAHREQLAGKEDGSVIAMLRILRTYLSGERNPYRILGLQSNADVNQVKKAHRALSLDCHPDVYQGDRLLPNSATLVINAAKDIILNPRHGKHTWPTVRIELAMIDQLLSTLSDSTGKTIIIEPLVKNLGLAQFQNRAGK